MSFDIHHAYVQKQKNAFIFGLHDFLNIYNLHNTPLIDLHQYFLTQKIRS